MNQLELLSKSMDMIFNALNKPMRMTEEEAEAHDIKMEQRRETIQEVEGELYCYRRDCPIREGRICGEGEKWPHCSYGRDWDK